MRPRFEVYKAISRQIREIFAEHTPIIEPLSLDEAYLDVYEFATLAELGGYTVLELALRRRLDPGGCAQHLEEPRLKPAPASSA